MKKNPGGKASALSLHKVVMPLARHFWPLVLVVMALSAVAAYGVTFLRTENDLMYMMPDENPVKVRFLDNQERFGDSVGIVLAFNSKDGIYQPDLALKLERFSQGVLQLNTDLLAARLRKVATLNENQARLLASWLQSLVSDPTFSPADFAQSLGDVQTTVDNLNDSAPSFPAKVDLGKLAKETAEALKTLAGNAPGKAAELIAVVQAPTDRRGKVKSQWVDRVVGLTRAESAWPELLQPDQPLALLKSWGAPEGPEAKAFLDTVLESGANSPAALQKLLADQKAMAASGLPDAPRRLLQAALSPERGQELLTAIQKAPKQIRVAKMIDLSAKGGPGPREERNLELRLKSWDFFQGALRSADDKSTLLLIQTAPNLTKESREDLLAMVKGLLDKHFKGKEYAVYEAGEAVTDHEISRLMTSDIASLLPIVVGVVALFLFISLGSLAGVIYPLITVLLSTLWCLGFMGFIGLPISIVGTVLPVLLVAVGSAYGIHFVHYFNLSGGDGQPREDVVRSAINVTGLGVLIAGLTTVAGFGSLGVNSIIALRDFGLAIAVGVGFALLLSLYIVPALLIKFGAGGKRGRAKEAAPQAPPKGDVYTRLSGFCVRRPWWVIGFFVAVLAFSIVGLDRLEVEMNNMNFFQKNSEIRIANRFINRNMAGSVGMRVVFDTGRKNGALDPALLELLRKLALKLPADNPEVGKVMSVVDLIKKMNQAFHYNDPAHYRLPALSDLTGARTPEALLGQYLFYVDKFGVKDRHPFVDGEKTAAVLSVQVKTAASSVSGRIGEYIERELAGPLGETLRQKGIKVSISGIGALYKEASDLLINGQMWSVLLSMIIVLLLVAFTMRSLIFGLLSILPLSITIMFNFGLMGFAGIPLDPGTAICACVAVGIGVDYSIHYLNRYKLERDNGLSHPAAAAATAAGSGKAIAINAVSVAAGFVVLTVSSFVPLVNLGILIALTMLLTALGSLSVIPAFLTIVARIRFPGRA